MIFYAMFFFVLLPLGKLPEWSIGADSKSVEPFGVPGVRIPHFPQTERRCKKHRLNCFQEAVDRLRT